MEAKFFDSLFGGDSANGVKLCMGLTEGDFWPRPAGLQVLYQGQNDTDIDFDKIIAASDSDGVFEIFTGQPLSRGLYVVRRINCAGREEKTISAAVKTEFDSQGNLIEQSCNKVFMVTAEQTEGGRVLLKWFYQQIHQAKKISGFKIYYDNGSGQIDYQTQIGSINYIGRKFYRFVTNELSGNSYKFCIRAVASDASDDGFAGQIEIELNREKPDGVLILQIGVI